MIRKKNRTRFLLSAVFLVNKMTSYQAVEIFFSFIKDEPVVCATGYIARSAQKAKDRLENFYVIGSMGLASSIALGVALSKPRRKVIALDGDGAALMNLGSFATVGALKPANFIHVVIDNGVYESTGNQPSSSSSVALDKIAQSAGYAHARRVDNSEALKKEMSSILSKSGPSFLLVKVSPDTAPAAPRVHAAPEVITENFSKCLRS